MATIAAVTIGLVTLAGALVLNFANEKETARLRAEQEAREWLTQRNYLRPTVSNALETVSGTISWETPQRNTRLTRAT